MSQQLSLPGSSADDVRLRAAQKRIRAMWKGHQHKQLMPKNTGGGFTTGGNVPGVSTYTGSDVTDSSSDFLGDWRSADSWMRFDLLRVRSRSRQLERGNNWCISFKKSLIQNVIGHSGFQVDPNVFHSAAYGDGQDGSPDTLANKLILDFRAKFQKAENFTTRKRLDSIDVDALVMSRACFDGECIFRKIRKFDNEIGFSWQMINPDYLDHNLNRIEPNGNVIKMGVEQDAEYKFPVAYWFLHRRPNDYLYNYFQLDHQRYYRVPANEIMHFFVQTEDEEQTRGWPWVFAIAVNLFRLGKYEDAAVVNAAIGASKMGFFKKIIPDGFQASEIQAMRGDDEGEIIDQVSPGSWQELPWNVEPVEFNPNYPDEQFGEFEKAMLRGIAACMGSSYMSLTGDVSDANFSNLRAAKEDEQENWKWLQNWLVRVWKKPEYEESVYRGILGRSLLLPLSKLDKFTDPIHTGRRWGYINPVDDVTAQEKQVGLCITSPTDIIRGQGRNRDKVFAQLKKDVEELGAMGLTLTPFKDKSGAADQQDGEKPKTPDGPEKKPVKKGK